ncbi:MAG: hypothetical protein KKA67_14735, partial [Spirochaetes bacterium]|nr:hypothetical protein [Spirochaetota bacterium]
TINRFMIGSTPIFLVLALPAAQYAAGPYLPDWFAVLARLMPTDGALRLARAAYASVPAAELAMAAASSIAWTALASVFILGPAVAASRGD